MADSRRSRLAWTWVAMVVPLALVVAHGVVMSRLNAPWRDWFISEYGPTEILSCVCFGLCAVLAVAHLRRQGERLPGRYRAALWVFAVGSAFVCIEEISYGQTFWDYHSPEWFTRNNNQQEFNLHNLAGDKPSRFLRRVGELGLPLFGLVLPLIWMRRPGGYREPGLGFFLFPRWELVGAVVGSMAVRGVWWWRKTLERFPDWTAGMSELQELIWAFAGVVWISAMSRRMSAEVQGDAPGGVPGTTPTVPSPEPRAV